MWYGAFDSPFQANATSVASGESAGYSSDPRKVVNGTGFKALLWMRNLAATRAEKAAAIAQVIRAPAIRIER
jgi:hypothetical protein